MEDGTVRRHCMIYKTRKDRVVKEKRNEQSNDIHEATREKMYTEQEMIEIIRLAQSQGGKE